MDLANFSTGELVLGVIIGVVCAFVCLAIARAKGLPPAAFFVLGLLFPLIGILVAVLMPARNGRTGRGGFGGLGPPPPPGPPPVHREPQHQPGWYPDPWQEGHIRYYDGTRWTADSQPGSTF